MSAIETVLDFLDRINKRDADKLAELMTEDHVFIDSVGNTVQGREKMRAQRDYLWRVFSFSSAAFSSSSFCPASPSLPSAVRRW